MSILIDNLLRDPRVGVDVDNETIGFTPDGKLTILDNAITTSKIKNNAISPEKLSFKTFQKISEKMPATNRTTVSFTGLDLEGDGGYLLFSVIKNPTSSSGNVRIFFNGDTITTNYWTQVVGGYGSTANVSRTNDTVFMGSVAGTTNFGVAYILKTIGSKTICFSWFSQNTGGSIENKLNIIEWQNTSNVNSIDITHSVSNGIGAYSNFKLYRIDMPTFFGI